MNNMIKHLKFLLPAIGTNESRKNLMWVKCEIKGDYLYMLAANAYIIKTVKTPYPKEITTIDAKGKEKTTVLKRGKFYIDLDAVKNAVKLSNRYSYVMIYKNKITVGNADVKYLPYNMDYPNLDTLINATKNHKVESFGFNADFMSSILKNNSCEGYSNPIKVDFTGNVHNMSQPIIRIDYLNGEHMAYMMPIDISGYNN